MIALREGGGPPPEHRLDVEQRIDEIVAQTFPASDPPAWGGVMSLIRRGSGVDAGPRSDSPETHAEGRPC